MAVVVLGVILTALAWALRSTSVRIDDVNGRFDDVHRRIDDLRSDVNARFAQRDKQLADLRQELKEELREVRTVLQEALKAGTSWGGGCRPAFRAEVYSAPPSEAFSVAGSNPDMVR